MALASPTARRTVDPITAEIIRHGIDAAADQMLLTLRRTTFTQVVYESLDCSGGFYDRSFRMMGHVQALPIFCGNIGLCIEQVAEQLAERGDDFEDGDVVLVNDPYVTGCHQWDTVLIVPAFIGGELAFYAAVKAHQRDIGASAPFPTDSTDVFQDGTIYPAVKLYRRGKRDEDLYRTALANTRLAGQMAGDLSAEIGSCRVGIKAVMSLIDRCGLDDFEASLEAIYEYGEAKMRAAVAGLPDGRYVSQAVHEHNGLDEVNLPWELAVEVRGDELVVDLTNVPPAQPGPGNAPYLGALSAVRCAVMSLIGGDVRASEGFFRPLTIESTPGSMYHALPPTACGLASYPLFVLSDRIRHALAQAAPNRLPAGFEGPITLCAWGTSETGRFWVDSINMVGGSPASSVYGDGGAPLMPVPTSGVRLVSFEVFEAKNPVLVERCEFVADTAGPGRYRGGPGIELVVRALSDAKVTIINECPHTAPEGLAGGLSGRSTTITVRAPNGEVSEYAKATGAPMPTGSRLEAHYNGGAGWGPPEERDPSAVVADIAAGILSEATARRQYPHAFGSERSRHA